jgi:hypothetical protein
VNQPLDPLVTVDRYVSPWDAHIVRGRLETEGLMAWVLNEHYIGVDWPSALALGLVRIVVPRLQEAQAREVMDALREGVFEAHLAAMLDEPGDSCPRCGSFRSEVFRDWLGRAVVAAAAFVLHVIFPPPCEVRCRDCGHRIG